MEIVAAIIGGIFVLSAALVPIYINKHKVKNKSANKKYEVDEASKYAISRITEIVKNEMRNNQLNVDGLSFKSSFNITDLKTFTERIYYPKKDKGQIEAIIDNARQKAFTIKYAEPKEDEKITDLKRIKLGNLESWETYFYNFLKKLGLNNFDDCEVLDVGIGNGHTVKNLYGNSKNIIGIDISQTALDYAKRILPNIKLIQNQAENLDGITNNSVDLVLGFRIFQSSLLDKRAALYEIFRVLKSGGYLIISIPIMFLKEDGTVLSGLIAPMETSPSLDYAQFVIDKIIKLLDTLNFEEIQVDKNSPFEYYISAKRP